MTGHVDKANWFCLRITSYTRRRIQSPAADEMNNLYTVAFFQINLLPVGAPDYFAVQFNRQAFGRERQMIDQFSKRNVIGHVARFAVDFDKQLSLLPPDFMPGE